MQGTDCSIFEISSIDDIYNGNYVATPLTTLKNVEGVSIVAYSFQVF